MDKKSLYCTDILEPVQCNTKKNMIYTSFPIINGNKKVWQTSGFLNPGKSFNGTFKQNIDNVDNMYTKEN